MNKKRNLIIYGGLILLLCLFMVLVGIKMARNKYAKLYPIFAEITQIEDDIVWCRGLETNVIFYQENYKCTISRHTILQRKGKQCKLKDFQVGDTVAILTEPKFPKFWEENGFSYCEMREVFKMIYIEDISILSLCGCSHSNSEFTKYSDQPESTANVKRMFHLEDEVDEGLLSYGIIDEKGSNETNTIYHLKEGENFKRFLLIDNYLGIDCEFAILTFINYVQSDYWIEGESNRVAKVNIQNKTSLFVPVELDGLQQGLNDVIFLIVPNPSEGERSETEIFLSYEPVYLRCTIFVGEGQTDIQRERVELPVFDTEEHSVYISTEPQADRHYGKAEAPSNKTLQLYISLNNADNGSAAGQERTECVLLLLKDFEQVPLLGAPFIDTEIELGKKIIVPYEEENEQAGYSEYIAIWIDKPYEIVESFTSDIYFSGFTGVKVLE